MPHPHHYLLLELSFGIDHLAPTVPQEIREEAKQILHDLEVNEQISRKEIKEKMYEIGIKTFPYRRSYHEVYDQREEELIGEKMLAHLQGHALEILRTALQQGIKASAFLKSSTFEQQCSADERFQMENIFVDAKQEAQAQLQKESENFPLYQESLEKWKQTEEHLKEGIMKVEALAQKESPYQEEITQKVEQLKEGFLSIERDPEPEEVKQLVIYWKGVLEEGN